MIMIEKKTGNIQEKHNLEFNWLIESRFKQFIISSPRQDKKQKMLN